MASTPIARRISGLRRGSMVQAGRVSLRHANALAICATAMTAKADPEATVSRALETSVP